MSGLREYLGKLQPSFNENNSYALSFESECHFAVQQLLRNDYLLSVSRENQQSLRTAIMNVAAVGISLNPAAGHAYLVPREGAVCLDISYKGLVKLATDSGAITMAKSELVYEGEKFEWQDMFTMPIHRFDPFISDCRDPNKPFEGLRGGYTVAKLPDGGVIVDHMSAADILKVKNSSPTTSAKSPWQKWPMEMIKKTLIKRAHKSWPQSTRLAEAIDVLNQHEGIDINREPEPDMSPERADALERVKAKALGAAIDEGQLQLIAGVKDIEQLDDPRLERLERYIDSQLEPATGEIA